MKKFKLQPKGLSLVELTIVLAISAMLIGIAIAGFSQRRTTAVQDAANQVAAEVQTVRNEAQKGLGPNTPAETAAVTSGASGQTLFGEAIEFRDNCGTPGVGCMRVYKLIQSASGGSISSYGSYDVPLQEGLAFDLSGASCSGFATCFQPTGAGSFNTPLTSGRYPLVVITNGNGAMYYFDTPAGTGGIIPGQPAANVSNYDAAHQGQLRVGMMQGSPVIDYYLNIDLSGGNSVTAVRQ